MKKSTERLLSQKVRNQWIIAPRRAKVFDPEIEEFEAVLKALPREKAFDLAEFTLKNFKLPNVTTIFPPATDKSIAAELLCDELRTYLNRYRSISIFRKMLVFQKHYLSLID